MIRVNLDNGYYLFKLGDLLYNRKISINKLIRDTNTDFKVIKRMITGDLVRIDIFVLSRLCDYLNCSINDIFEYVPNKKWIEPYYKKVRFYSFFVEYLYSSCNH